MVLFIFKHCPWRLRIDVGLLRAWRIGLLIVSGGLLDGCAYLRMDVDSTSRKRRDVALPQPLNTTRLHDFLGARRATGDANLLGYVGLSVPTCSEILDSRSDQRIADAA